VLVESISLAERVGNRGLQSSQLFSTVSLTRLVYSFMFSRYRLEASTLAGEFVLGSLSKLEWVEKSVVVHMWSPSWHMLTPKMETDAPLNARQNGGNVVCRTPPVLQNVEA
jgi:hypothetical protein